MPNNTQPGVGGVGAGCVMLVLGGILVTCLGGVCSKSTPSPDDDKAMAITMAQHFVKDGLKSPSSASFPWSFNEYSVSQGANGRWSVSGYVDAANSFNAKIRTRWSVEMRRIGTDWELLSINIMD